MKPHIDLNSPVLHIGKKGVDNPNPINAEGIMTENEKRVAGGIFYGISDILNRDLTRYQH